MDSFTQASCGLNKGQLEEEEIKNQKRKRQKGQLVLEYILLMILAVSMALLVKSYLIGGNARDINNAGILTQFFYKITAPIANDEPGA